MSESAVKSGCKCTSCTAACSNKPGWFMPGEAERLAEFFNVEFEQVFREHLSVDWWEADNVFEEDVFLLSPAVVGVDPGEEFDANPRGVCVFFKDGECSIHEVKPFECAKLMHTEEHATVSDRHYGVARAWAEEAHQKQIEGLLGRKPIATQYEGSIFDMF